MTTQKRFLKGIILLLCFCTWAGAAVVKNSTVVITDEDSSSNDKGPTTFQLEQSGSSSSNEETRNKISGKNKIVKIIKASKPKIDLSGYDGVASYLPPPSHFKNSKINSRAYDSNFDTENKLARNSEREEEEEENPWNSVDLWEPHEQRKANGEFPPPREEEEEAEEKEDDEENEEDGWLDGLRARGRILNRVMVGVNSMCSTLFPFVEAMGGRRFCVKNPTGEFLGDDEQ